MASVEFEQVDKIYPDGTRAISDCNLRIEDGELMVFVGPSGCGKSTLLRLVAGLEQVTRGTVRIGSRVVNELRPQSRNIAMVFQDYALYPHLSARGNLEFPLRMRKLKRDEVRHRVDRVAALLGITDLLERLPKHLSGGQRQRVAMGRALVREPSAFLLDEPLSNLDAKLRIQVRAEIKELQQRTATTMIYVTHDQVEAMTLGDRVAVLHEGRLQQVAAPGDLYQRPANVFVAGFIGTPPMNLFPTRLSLVDQQTVALKLGSQLVSIPITSLQADEVRSALDVPLTAGLRPEALRLVEHGSATGAVAAMVEHIESLGHESLAHVRVSNGPDTGEVIRLVVRLSGMPALSKEAAVRVGIDSSAIHVFDAGGKSLTAQAPLPLPPSVTTT